MSLYKWQKECLELIKDRNGIISAPTNAGKTKVAYLWMDVKGAVEGRHKIIYTVPIKALANEKTDELIQLYGKEHVGIETGDVKVRENSPILVCTQEIYTRKYARQKKDFKVVMDEFHYIFSAKDRARAYIDGIRYAQKSHRLLIMSATLSKPERIKAYLEKNTGKDFVLYETDFRPTKLIFTEKVFTLKDIPPYSLVYVFNTYAIDRMVRRLTAEYPQLPILKRRKIQKIAQDFKVNLEKFPEVLHGIAKYHAKLTYTEKRFIERLVREGFISIVFATSALGVGVNLPFQWVLFATLKVPTGRGEQDWLSKIDFVQLAGRAGRKGFFDEGYVGFLKHDYVPYEDFYESHDHYRTLLVKPLEEPVIKLTVDLEAVVKGHKDFDEEIEYVSKYSEPSLTEEEVKRLRQWAESVKKTLSGLSELERTALSKFYLPELELEENIRLAKLIVSRQAKLYENKKYRVFYSSDLESFIARDDEVKELLVIRKIMRTLQGKKFEDTYLYFEGLEEVEKRIKELDPLLLEVG